MKQDSSISWIDLRFFLREKYTFFLIVVLVQPGNYLPVDIMCSKLPAQSGILTPSVHMHAAHWLELLCTPEGHFLLSQLL